MNPWRPFPLLRLLFPFTGGILFAISSNPVTGVPFWVFIPVIILIFLISSIPASPKQFKIRWIIGLLINLTVFLFGLELTRQRMISDSTTNIVTEAEGWYAGEVIEPVSYRGRISKAVVSVSFNHKDGKWLPVVGKTLVNLRMQHTALPVKFGDFILFYTRFQEITDNGNPHSFNYAKYLQNRGVLYTAWVEENSWKQLQVKTTHPFRKFAFRLRDRILDLLRKNQVRGDEFSVAAALLLGYGDELDSDLRNSYAATGVTHILSVSGMHVGIIFLFLEFMLGFMNKNRLGKAMKLVIMTLSIWFYAFLTGLSPAVLRAATMLSFILVGRSLKRSPEILNILAASLFFLLTYNPVLLRDMGFQLSYLAVLGIVLLYRPINNLVFFRNWMARKIWSLLSVTLAAQLATTPLCLFYFHQFPNYFFITNLIVVPFSSLIIYSGIAAVAIGTVPFLSMIGAQILTYLAGALNFFIHFMENLPGSTSRGIFLSIPEMFLVYLIFVTGCMFFIQRKKTAIFTFLAGVILLNGSLFSRQINRLNRTRFTIYNLRNMPAYDFTVQDRAIVWYDLRHLNNFQAQLDRNFPTIENNWNEGGVRSRVAVWSGNRTIGSSVNFLSDQIFRKGCFIQFLGKRIGILKEKIPPKLQKTISLDYLILSYDAMVSIREVLNVFKVKMIIIDGMNSAYRIKAWCKEAKRFGMSCYPVSLKGAFVEEL